MHTRITGFCLHVVLAASLLLAPCAHATTRLVLGLDELVTRSAQIFVGTVEAVAPLVEDGIVYTRVVFAVESVVEGAAADTLELRFLGGSAAGISTEVAGQFVPAPGMRGLWFVDGSASELVNPLTGWSQGYFPIVVDSSGTAWLDLQDHPDYGILAPPDPLAAKMRAMNFPEAEVAARFPQALQYPLADFVDVIRAIAAGEAQ